MEKKVCEENMPPPPRPSLKNKWPNSTLLCSMNQSVTQRKGSYYTIEWYMLDVHKVISNIKKNKKNIRDQTIPSVFILEWNWKRECRDCWELGQAGGLAKASGFIAFSAQYARWWCISLIKSPFRGTDRCEIIFWWMNIYL